MSFAVHLARPAERLLDRLDKPLRRRIVARLDDLADDPFDPRFSKSVTGVVDLRAARVGRWRVLFSVSQVERTGLVLAIRPRGQAYGRR